MTTSWAPREVVFDTPRLAGRRLDAADIDAMFAVYGDAVAMRWVGDGEPITREGCFPWVEVQRGALRLNDDGSHTQLFAWHAADTDMLR
jgi:hypothetical protein